MVLSSPMHTDGLPSHVEKVEELTRRHFKGKKILVGASFPNF